MNIKYLIIAVMVLAGHISSMAAEPIVIKSKPIILTEYKVDHDRSASWDTITYKPGDEFLINYWSGQYVSLVSYPSEYDPYSNSGIYLFMRLSGGFRSQFETRIRTIAAERGGIPIGVIVDFYENGAISIIISDISINTDFVEEAPYLSLQGYLRSFDREGNLEDEGWFAFDNENPYEGKLVGRRE